MSDGPLRLFVGRSRELSDLDSALHDACAGRGRLCLITGDAGIGKTRLAEELAERAGPGARVLWGRCWEGGGAPGYWPWIQILRRLAEDAGIAAGLDGDAAAAIARLVPDLVGHEAPTDQRAVDTADSEPARFALFDAIAGVLRRAAAQRPLVLVLDDLHATDISSLLLLEFVARALRDAAVLLIGIYRERAVETDLGQAAALARAGRLAHRVPLGGWREDDIARYVEGAFHQAAAPALTSAVHRVTEGNPFYVVEILRHLTAAHGGTVPTAIPADAPIPHGVRHSIRARLDALGASCRSALEVAAVIGREFDLDLLAAAAAQPAEALLGDLERGAGAGAIIALRGPGSRWGFSHGLIRATLYDDLAAGRRAELHGRIGEALVRRHRADPQAGLAEIAHHFLHGAAAGNASVALDYAARAAREAAARTAYEEAAARYDDALDLQARLRPDGLAERAELLLALGAVQARIAAGAGRPAFQRAAAAARAAGDPALLARAALGFTDRGLGVPHHLPDRDAVALLEEALAPLPDGDSTLRARLLARLAVELAVSEDRRRGDELSAAAVAMADRLDDPAARAHALSARSFVLWRWDDAADRPAIAAEVVRLAESLGDGDLELQGRTWLLLDFMRAGDAHRLDLQIARYAPLAERLAHPRYLWMVANLGAMRALWRGDLASAESQIRQALAIAERVDDDNARLSPLVQLFALRREQGRLAEQENAARFALDRAGASPVPRTFLALLLSELGQLEEARRLFDSLARDDFADLRRERRLGVLPYLAEVCAALGDARRAALLSELLRPLAEVNIPYGASLGFGCGAHYLGLLAETQAALDEAIAHFDTALSRHARMDAPPWLAGSQLACARALRARGRSGDRERGDRLLAEGLATARALGLQNLIDRAGRIAAEADADSHRQRASQAVGHDGGELTSADSHPADAPRPATGTDGIAASHPGRVLTFPERTRRARSGAVRADSTRLGVFRREGEFWAVGDGAALVRLKDSKGLRYLAHLLRHPGRELHVTDLVALERGPAGGEPAGLREADLHHGRGGGTAPLLDARAKAAYKRRLEDLRDALDEATRFNDLERAARARAEIEILGRELARGVGIGGRDRTAAPLAERARLNVSRTIADAVKRIAAHDPGLGRLFATTIKTGAFCSYTPDPRFPIDWQL